MGTTFGILNHLSTAERTWKSLTPTNNTTNGTSASNSSNDSSDDSAAISANDFLTLLVTEMKNQDPTANTDPNQYINQLVQVNSLQQLISINQTLTSDSKSLSNNSAAPASIPGTKVDGTKLSAVGTASRGIVSGQSPPSAVGGAPAISTASRVSGNLSVAAAAPAAQRVAQSLSGHHPKV